jgi:hypothetical protein
MTGRHYGLNIGDLVEQRAFGHVIQGTVVELSPTDNNRAYIRTTEDGTVIPVIAEWCVILSGHCRTAEP